MNPRIARPTESTMQAELATLTNALTKGASQIASLEQCDWDETKDVRSKLRDLYRQHKANERRLNIIRRRMA